MNSICECGCEKRHHKEIYNKHCLICKCTKFKPKEEGSWAKSMNRGGKKPKGVKSCVI